MSIGITSTTKDFENIIVDIFVKESEIWDRMRDNRRRKSVNNVNNNVKNMILKGRMKRNLRNKSKTHFNNMMIFTFYYTILMISVRKN